MSEDWLFGWMIGVIFGMGVAWYLRGAHERELRARLDGDSRS